MKSILAKVEAKLKALGFMRKGVYWNRRRGSLVDVVGLQISKVGDAATINVGVLSTSAYAAVWERESPKTVQEPDCTISTRVGMLMGNEDKWWNLDDPSAPDSIGSAIDRYVVPFLAKIDGAASMETWLEDTGVEGKAYPLPIMNLAALRAELGKREEACATLDKLEHAKVGAWRSRIKALKARLECS